MSSDHLASLPAEKVAAFYRRLAELVASRIDDSLAAKLLLHWLDGGGANKQVAARYVKNVAFVVEYLREEVRPVFLTQKRAELASGPVWAGIVPRIAKLPPFHKKPGVSSGGPYPMMYEGPSVKIPLSVQARAAFAIPEDPDVQRQVDLLYALHSFALETHVEMTTKATGEGSSFRVGFSRWRTRMFDYYDWDPSKYITVPNPDYGTSASGAVAPDQKTVRVYHKHAKRIERAGFARPFGVESADWEVTDTTIAGPATVDVSRCWSRNGKVSCRP